MAINLFESKRFFINTVSSIWQRFPFIISCQNDTGCNNLILQLTEFIPAYRQFIVCGNVPRSIEFSHRKPRILDSSELTILRESLFASFDEERPGTRPLQLVYFNATPEIFSTLLNKLKCGWFATTNLSYSEIGPLIEIFDIETVDDCSIIFLKPTDDVAIEEQLFDKSERRSLEVASFIYQLKMSEINLVGNAILKEIENGKDMTQVEIKELFNIDDLTLQRVIYLLNAETQMDVRPYIIFTPKTIQNLLKKFLSLNGVILVGALQDQRIIGLAKARNINFSVSHLFHALAKTLQEVKEQFNFGKHCQLIIELKDNQKILLVANEECQYAFLIDTNKNINILTEEIMTLL